MATDALEQQLRTCSPPLQKFPNKNDAHAASLVSMMMNYGRHHGRSVRDALSAVIDHENNQFPLPFPIIQWEEGESYDDEELAFLEQICRGLQQVKISKPYNNPMDETRKSKPCLHRSLACCDHLSLLALDQLVSMHEKEQGLQHARPRLSMPF